jgi:DNA-binding CsgD family transcriptional regulator
MSRGAITWEQARALLRVQRQARELGVGTQACRAHLLAAAVALVGAEHGVFVVDPAFVPGGKGPYAHVATTGDRPADARMLDATIRLGRSAHPLLDDLTRRSAGARRGDVWTVRRLDVVGDRDWYESAWVKEYLAPAQRDDGLVSAIATATPGLVRALSFVRARGAAPFSENDRDVLNLFHVEYDAMLVPPTPDDALPPRVQETFECLLTGASDKEIALELGVGFHTVREYVKRILSAYGVSSRAQLIAHVAGTDRGRRPGACSSVDRQTIGLPSPFGCQLTIRS